MSQFTPRVSARTNLARLILEKYVHVVPTVGLTKADLEVVVEHGELAAKADAEQQEQLAAAQVQRSIQKDLKNVVFSREDAMRNRLPAIIAGLAESSDPETKRLSFWLDRLSFARYRFRTLPSDSTEPATPAEQEEERKVKRVQREDISSRASALASFSRALTKPGREAIVTAFEARGLTRDDLNSLAVDADTVAEIGRNLLQAAEATQREADAVNAQKAKWIQIRRMVRALGEQVPEVRQRLCEC
jgi:hypothetical protein